MSMFTKRQYIWLASAMRDTTNAIPLAGELRPVAEVVRRRVIEIFADQLAGENPGFDRDQFLENVFNSHRRLD